MDAKKIYNEFNPKLVSILPMRDPHFIAELTQQNLFSGALKEEVMGASTQADASSCFLYKAVERSLDIDDTEPFDRLLIVMHRFGGVTLQKLAKKIIQKMNGEKLRHNLKVLKRTEAAKAASSKDTYTVQLSVMKDLRRGHYAVNCSQCSVTCHYLYTNITDDDELHNCPTMDDGGKRDAECCVCPGKCSWKKHEVNSSYFKGVTKKMTLEDLKAKPKSYSKH